MHNGHIWNGTHAEYTTNNPWSKKRKPAHNPIEKWANGKRESHKWRYGHDYSPRNHRFKFKFNMC